jgi:uncharacterized membrane-anchored protein
LPGAAPAPVDAIVKGVTKGVGLDKLTTAAYDKARKNFDMAKNDAYGMAQNQSLLASMDRRAKLQLRLQQTVEGLSIAAIVYYMAGLVGYVANALGHWPLLAAWLPSNETLVGLAVLPVVLGVAWGLRRLRH